MTTTKTKTTTAILLALALLVSGCTNDNTDTVAESTTTQSFPDLSDTKKPTTTNSTTTTEPEPTLEQTKAEIEAFILGTNEKWHACTNQPQNCDIERQLGEIFTGPQLEANLEFVLDMKNEGLVAKPPEDPRNDRYIIESIEVSSPVAPLATVFLCEIDGHTIYKPAGAPDGSDLIIAGQIISVERRAELEKDQAGDWKINNFTIDATYNNGDGCEQ